MRQLPATLDLRNNVMLKVVPRYYIISRVIEWLSNSGGSKNNNHHTSFLF